MINIRRVKSYCCEDISLIENYDLAIADNTQTWHCHHRLEIDLNKSIKELKDLGLYYDRPASELKFMTPFDHNSLHKSGIKESEETKRKKSEAHKGLSPSKETKKKISDANKGQKCANKGKHRVYREDGSFYFDW